MTGHDGYDSISVATGGNDPDEVKAALQRELGRDFLVRTGEEAAEQQAQDLSDALGFIRTALLVFAGVALLVGGFLIFNTFTVTVAQRTKEFALLRVLGASRGADPALGADRDVRRRPASRRCSACSSASCVAPGAGRADGRGGHRPRHDRDRDHARHGHHRPGRRPGRDDGLRASCPARRATRIEPVAAMRDSVTPGVGHLRTRRVVGSLALMGARPGGAASTACSAGSTRASARGLAARPRRAC